MKSILLLLLLLTPLSTSCFTTLTEASAYAHTLNEKEEPDPRSPLTNPTFEKSIQHTIPHGFRKYRDRFLEFLQLKSRPAWIADDLAQRLTQVTDQLKQTAVTTPYALFFTVNSQSRLYIIGDLNGAFHSLIRYLLYLKDKGVITDTLRITKPYYYLIYNGNALGDSPYNSETLTLILDLMRNNPDNVLYVVGKLEFEHYWENYSLKKEFALKAPSVTPRFINSFFDQLPTAIFVQGEDKKLVKIAATPHSFTSIPQAFVAKKSERPLPFTLTEENKSGNKIPISVRIAETDRSITYQATQGLQLLPSKAGQTIWSVLSSPTPVYQRLYQFYYDAFVEITPAKQLEDWTISLIKRDIRTKAPFESTTFSLVTGVPKGTLSSKEPLFFGCTLDLSKTSAALGKRLREGMELRTYKENIAGGINGRPIRIIFLDDHYTPRLAKQNAETFLKTYHTSRLLCPLGTPTTEAFLPLVKEKKIVVLFPCTGAPLFRNPALTHLINLRPSYAREAEALIEYAYNMLQGRKFALFYQDDSYGQGPLFAAREALKKRGIKEWLETAYLRNNPNIEGPAKKIIDFNPDILLFFSTPGPSEALIHKLGVNKVANTILMGISFLTDIFRDFLQKKGLSIIMSQIVPYYNDDKLPIAQEYQQAMQKLRPGGKLSSDSFEAYISTSVLIEVLHSIQNPFTDEDLIRHIESLKNYRYKGLTLNFNPATRELLSDVWIDPGGGAQWILSSFSQDTNHNK